MLETIRKSLKPSYILILIMGLALVLRAISADHRPMIADDETVYVRMAENLSVGKAPFDITGMTSTVWTPLTPMYISGLAHFVGSYIVSAYVIEVVFGTLIILPVYLLGRQLFSERTGLMAGVLVAVSPLLIDYSSRVYSESLYVFFMMMGLVFGWEMMKRNLLLPSVLTGLSLGLAFLANSSALIYLAFLSILALAVTFVRGSWRRSGVNLSLMLAVFSMFAAPYIFFLHHESGQWTYTGKQVYLNSLMADLRWDTTQGYMNGALQLTDDGHDVKINRLAEKTQNDSAVSAVLKQPGQSLHQFIQNYESFDQNFIPQVFFIGYLPLLGLGLFARSWDRQRAKSIGYVILMMSPALLVLLLWEQGPRYYIPFVPLGLLFAAEGWQKLENWGLQSCASIFNNSGNRWSRLIPWLVGAMVLIPIMPIVKTTVTTEPYQPVYREAGEWLKKNAGPGNTIMSVEFSAPYYSGGDAVSFPYADYERTTAYARYMHIDYLVITKEDLDQWRPQMSRLLLAADQHPDWEKVKSTNYGTDDEVFIFKLREIG